MKKQKQNQNVTTVGATSSRPTPQRHDPKNQKGITLIALVITIIVLLILAGVTINMLTGDNGLIKVAQRAKEETLKAEKQEQLEMIKASLLMQKFANKNGANKEAIINKIVEDLINNGTITEEEKENIEKILKDYQNSIINNIETTTEKYIENLIEQGIIAEENKEEIEKILKEYISEINNSKEEITEKYINKLIQEGLITEDEKERTKEILEELANGGSIEECINKLIQEGIITDEEKTKAETILNQYLEEITNKTEEITEKYIEKLIEEGIITEENKEETKTVLKQYHEEVATKNEQTQKETKEKLEEMGITEEEAGKILEEVEKETIKIIESDEKTAIEEYIEQLEKEGIIEEGSAVEKEDGSYEIITEDGYIIIIKPDPENENDIIIETEYTGQNTQKEDKEPPTVTVSTENIRAFTATLIVTANDSHSGLAETGTYKYYLNDSLITTLETNNYTYTGLSLNTAYTLGVIVTDKAGNESQLTTTTITTEKPTVETTLQAGDYVNYVDKSGTTRKCVVLYDVAYNTAKGTNYGIQIITSGTLGTVTLGSTNFSTVQTSYNNAISTLNSKAAEYLNTTYASSARSVGSVPNNPSSETTTFFTSGYSYMSSYNGKFKNMDSNYATDWNQMETLNIHTIGSHYWLASRNVVSNSYKSLFAVRYGYSNGILSDYNLFLVYSDEGPYAISNPIALRPVFTLKSGIKVTGGSGTSGDPWILGT